MAHKNVWMEQKKSFESCMLSLGQIRELMNYDSGEEIPEPHGV
jgi:hypothetical protein